MRFSGVTLDQIHAAVDKANQEHDYALTFAHTSTCGRRIQGRIVQDNSRSRGARTAASGRRTKAACWHAHRDVLGNLFAAVPTARVSSRLADYRGAAEFRDTFPATRHTNVGSRAAPREFGSLCECER